MKKKILLLFAVLAMAVSASAQDFTDGSIKYTITSPNEPYTVEVTSGGQLFW